MENFIHQAHTQAMVMYTDAKAFVNKHTSGSTPPSGPELAKYSLYIASGMIVTTLVIQALIGIMMQPVMIIPLAAAFILYSEGKVSFTPTVHPNYLGFRVSIGDINMNINIKKLSF